MMPTVDDLPRNMRAKTQPDPTTGCWLWTGATQSNGYGCVGVYGKSQLAHRVSYELLVGPIPNGLVIDHVVARGCRHRACINPAHLEPVTNLENIRRGVYANRTHCPQGHAYAGDNLIFRIRRNGQVQRNCRTCGNANRRVAANPKVPPGLEPDDPRHGTGTGYTYHRCRCGPCRQANTNRLRAYRWSKSA